MRESELGIQIISASEGNRLDFAAALVEDKRFSEAAEEYRQILADNPDSVQAWLGQGKLHAIGYRYDEAIACFQTALSLDPVLVDGHVQLGNTYLKQQKQEARALKAFEQALKLNPKSAQAHFGAARIFTLQGQIAAAKQMFYTAIALDPDMGIVYVKLSDLLQRERQLDEAVQLLIRLVQVKPDADYGHERLGQIYLMQGKSMKANAAFQAALDLNPESVKAQIGFARTLIHRNQLEDALDVFKKMAPASTA